MDSYRNKSLCYSLQISKIPEKQDIDESIYEEDADKGILSRLLKFFTRTK